MQKYFKELTVDQCRTKFRYRTKMLKIKFNMKNDKQYSSDNWLCNSCEKCIESQSHILWCHSYAHLREGKNLSSDNDLTNYISQVMITREKLNLTRWSRIKKCAWPHCGWTCASLLLHWLYKLKIGRGACSLAVTFIKS